MSGERSCLGLRQQRRVVGYARPGRTTIAREEVDLRLAEPFALISIGLGLAESLKDLRHQDPAPDGKVVQPLGEAYLEVQERIVRQRGGAAAQVEDTGATSDRPLTSGLAEQLHRRELAGRA